MENNYQFKVSGVVSYSFAILYSMVSYDAISFEKTKSISSNFSRPIHRLIFFQKIYFFPGRRIVKNIPIFFTFKSAKITFYWGKIVKMCTLLNLQI